MERCLAKPQKHDDLDGSLVLSQQLFVMRANLATKIQKTHTHNIGKELSSTVTMPDCFIWVWDGRLGKQQEGC